MNITNLMISVAVLGVAACGSNDPLRDARREAQMQASIDETYAYIDGNQLATVNHFRFQHPLRYEYHNDLFVVVETYGGAYLVEMRRRCPELGSRDIYLDMADIRSSQNMVRAGIDTIRGCRIESIYELPAAADSAESPETAADNDEEATAENDEQATAENDEGAARDNDEQD